MKYIIILMAFASYAFALEPPQVAIETNSEGEGLGQVLVLTISNPNAEEIGLLSRGRDYPGVFSFAKRENTGVKVRAHGTRVHQEILSGGESKVYTIRLSDILVGSGEDEPVLLTYRLRYRKNEKTMILKEDGVVVESIGVMVK